MGGKKHQEMTYEDISYGEVSYRDISLKGQCHEIIFTQFFSSIISFLSY
jgi:hypothetical protein